LTLPDLKSFSALTKSASGFPASAGLGAIPWPLSPWHPAHTADLSFPAAAFPAACAAPATPNDAIIDAVNLRAISVTSSRNAQKFLRSERFDPAKEAGIEDLGLRILRQILQSDYANSAHLPLVEHQMACTA
jgi:hypothetical protein